MLIIGSTALKDVLGLRYGRMPADLDFIGTYPDAIQHFSALGCRDLRPMNKGKTLVGFTRNGQIHEVSIAWPKSTNAELLEMYPTGIAPLNVLYALKMSHRYLRNSPHFYKTMADIKLMREHSATIPPELMDWYKRREKETYDYKHPSLAQNKMGFFSGDGVNYVYDHDSLHKAVAFFKRPMYSFYTKDGAEVACDRNKWNQLPYDSKLKAVAEECAVLALERSLVPFPGKMTEYEAFRFALMKVCTSITSGWFREFAWENHEEVLKIGMDYDYFNMFEKALVEGIVQPYGRI